MFRHGFVLLLLFSVPLAGCDKKAGTRKTVAIAGQKPVNPCSALKALKQKINVPLNVGFGLGVDSSSLDTLMADVFAYADWLGIDVQRNISNDFSVDQTLLFSDTRASLKASETNTEKALIAPVVNVIKSRSSKTHKRVDLVVFESLTNEKSVAASFIEARGLTVSTYSENNPYETHLQGIEAHPTVFISLEKLRDLPRRKQASVVVHEIGHALGLTHSKDNGNIMATSPNLTCDGVFNTEQIEIMKDSAADF